MAESRHSSREATPSRPRGALSPAAAGWTESFVHAPDGTRLYTRVRSGTPPLASVLCDGIACDGFIWRYLIDDLLPLSDIVHWHYRGHGRSGAPVDADRVGIEAFVDDLEAVREAHVDQPAILFGHSMGCQVALEGYRRRPEGVAGIVLINGAAGRITHTFKGGDALAQALPTLLDNVERHPHIARALWSNFPPEAAARIALATGEVDADAIDPADLVRYSEHVANLDLRMFLRMLMTVGNQTAEDMLASIDVPVLIFAGTLDSFTPPNLAQDMADAIPDSTIHVVEGASHVVPVERREFVREALATFVEEKVKPRLSAS